ncbi:hypothetical protein FACS189459_1270 [Bacilli bacterium]|nr:hypothetical protein FACS189459_1270 [Bacilli bacterium]
MNKLLVYLNKEKIGVLSGDSRNPKFSYTISVFNTPLSLSMKDTTKSYGKSFVHFIENLRIEDKEKLKLISAKSKLSPENYYQYFKTFGLDCAGSIQFVDEQEVEKIYSESTNIIEVNDKEIEKKVLDNVNNINIEDEKQHCSLAGYQPKILLLKKEGR